MSFADSKLGAEHGYPVHANLWDSVEGKTFDFVRNGIDIS